MCLSRLVEKSTELVNIQKDPSWSEHHALRANAKDLGVSIESASHSIYSLRKKLELLAVNIRALEEERGLLLGGRGKLLESG